MTDIAPRPRRVRAGLVVALLALLAAPPVARADFRETTLAVPAPAMDPGFPVFTSGAGFSVAPQFADIDLDGRFEVIAVDDLGVLYVVGQNGVSMGGWPQPLGAPASGPPAVGDLNHDGQPDIAVVTQNGRLRTFSNTGALLFPTVPLPSPPVGGPVLAEMDTTGQLAVVEVTQDGTLHAINAKGQEVPGFPIVTGQPASGGAFTFIAGDNFPRVGFLSSTGGALVYFTYGLPDAQYSYNQGGVTFGPAMPVSGARSNTGLLDVDNLFLPARYGQWWRFDPTVLGSGGSPTTMAAVAGDSILDTPCMVDVTGDLLPELAFRSQRGETLSVYIADGGTGVPLPNFPKRYLASSPGGGIVAADLGDGGTPEIVFNQGGTKVTCLKADGTSPWTLPNVSTTVSPALGDLDGDGALDMAVVTTDGQIQVYTLGTGGVGPKGIEWPNNDGPPDRTRRHHIRDRASLRPQWPPPFTPQSAFMTRPEFADLNDDGSPEAIWSDYASSKTWVWKSATATLPGWPQTYAFGSVLDAPAVGDITGDGVYETVQSTNQGYVVWGDRNGNMDSKLVDGGHVLTEPVLADLNGDGVLDVIVGSDSGRLYAVNAVNKTILAGWPVTCAGAIALPVAVGDITGDGQTDVIAVSGGRVLNAFARTGGVQLAGWPKSYTSGSTLSQPILVPVAGNPGLAVSFAQARTDSTIIMPYLVGASGSPRPGWPKRLSGTAVFGPVAGDFDNDGQPDFVFSTDTDSMYVYLANGGRIMTSFLSSPTVVEVFGMVDVDLDHRPDIVAVSDHSVVLGLRFNGLLARSFNRLTYFMESGQPPAFGDMDNDHVMEMAVSDLGTPVLYQWGFGSWNQAFAPWPMKNHDARHTNAYSGPTVVGVEGPLPGLATLGAEWARALPNPSTAGVALTHSRPLEGRYVAAIYDLRGRLVRRIADGDAPPGAPAPTWTWDGRDDSGRTEPAGVYFYRVVDARGSLATRIVRVR